MDRSTSIKRELFVELQDWLKKHHGAKFYVKAEGRGKVYHYDEHGAFTRSAEEDLNWIRIVAYYDEHKDGKTKVTGGSHFFIPLTLKD